MAVTVLADEQLEMASTSILAGFRWAQRWPHMARVLKATAEPALSQDAGRKIKKENGVQSELLMQ